MRNAESQINSVRELQESIQDDAEFIKEWIADDYGIEINTREELILQRVCGKIRERINKLIKHKAIDGINRIHEIMIEFFAQAWELDYRMLLDITDETDREKIFKEAMRRQRAELLKG